MAGSIAGNCVSDVSGGQTLTYASTAPGDSIHWSVTTTVFEEASTVGATLSSPSSISSGPSTPGYSSREVGVVSA